ncbi:TROVE domain-containing protein [Micromonospora endophytica]|uniref:TROVE domain-containing protein n=2 Tax=Micromonospora endophytica TaxID=515350 RepID=A0A2W2CQ77_9ACTN|nr:TROVE domain-containing protein [Micromonospora endophytica]PZG00723.1 TROVE domain-containing protein [Micromonospora endophytica]RIW44844.1 TROVE domain-containing protein [Micromonospora endophytica]BCJ57574.1 RNA-binding protein [Micromonospora endophytica]
MAKFNIKLRRQHHGTGEAVTAEGAPGFSREPRAELFLLAVSNMVGEDTFYEGAAHRDARFRELVAAVAVTDPEWFARFVPWLRTGAMLRSAAVVAALEGARAQVAAGVPGSRAIVDAALQRADEPGEALAYWLGRHGRALPKPVKRGIADAVVRLYHERSLLKYDAEGSAVRFGDVIDLTHPRARDERQGELFRHALDRRHQRDNPLPESLPVLAARAELMGLPVGQRREVTDPAVLSAAGMTWEALAGWRQSAMDAAAWEAIIPTMGYLALLRNLRNFDRAGVSDAVAEAVAAKLADPGEVARSRVLPMRFLSAYNATPSLRWAYPLEQALQHALANVPALDARTLILIDTSFSMSSAFSKDGTLCCWDAATVFGLALAARARNPTVVSFSDASRVFPAVAGESVLTAVRRFKDGGYFYGGGTRTEQAVRDHYDGHDRLVILTDEQAHWHGEADVTAAVPARVPVYTWNLAGYRVGHMPTEGNRHTFGGLSDAAFAMIPLIEVGSRDQWPF